MYHSSSSRRRSPSPPRGYRSSGGGGSSRRRSPSPRRDRRDDRHRDEKSPPPKKDTDLPSEFSRDREEEQRKDDNRNVLERMERSYVNGPLEVLFKCTKEQLKLKIWTRNFKEVRGICTGFVTAFDKHWNIALRDVDEICLKPKKGKTPYLRDLQPGDSDSIPEAKPKIPKEKKPKEPEVIDLEGAPPAQDAPMSGGESASTDAEGNPTDPKKKKRKNRKKKKCKIDKRHVGQLFIRGDNVVMVSIINPSDPADPSEAA